jgi:hypothetical protein
MRKMYLPICKQCQWFRRKINIPELDLETIKSWRDVFKYEHSKNVSDINWKELRNVCYLNLYPDDNTIDCPYELEILLDRGGI